MDNEKFINLAADTNFNSRQKVALLKIVKQLSGLTRLLNSLWRPEFFYVRNALQIELTKIHLEIGQLLQDIHYQNVGDN